MRHSFGDPTAEADPGPRSTWTTAYGAARCCQAKPSFRPAVTKLRRCRRTVAWGAQLREMGFAFGLHLLPSVSDCRLSFRKASKAHARSFDVPRFYNSSRADAATRNMTHMILEWMSYPIVVIVPGPARAPHPLGRRARGARIGAGRAAGAKNGRTRGRPPRRHTAPHRARQTECRVPREERESKSREHAKEEGARMTTPCRVASPTPCPRYLVNKDHRTSNR
jgi:hypothetical protein